MECILRDLPTWRSIQSLWLQAHLGLGCMGTSAGEDLPLARCPTKALDRRQEAQTRFGRDRALLPVRPGTRDHRSHNSFLLVLPSGMVAHPRTSWRGHFQDRRRLHAIMVDLLAQTVDGRQEAGSRLPICTCGMGTLEGEEREVLSQRLIIGSAVARPHQAIGGPVD